MDQETKEFLIEYIDHDLRNQKIEETIIKVDDEYLIVQHEITIADLTIITLLAFLIAFYVGNSIYRKLRELF